MQFVQSDRNFFQPVEQGSPDYDSNNPIMRIVHQIEDTDLVAEREHYLPDSIQHLMPYADAGLWGPSHTGDPQQSDPYQQDDKNDFQKQNINTFKLGDMSFVRGYATAGDWTGVFLKVSYTDGPHTELWKAAQGNIGTSLRLWIRVGATATNSLITVPYNAATNRFEVEFWSFAGDQNVLNNALGSKAQNALANGLIQLRPDLVKGTPDAFSGSSFDTEREGAIRNGMENSNSGQIHMWNRFADHTLHPIRSLRLELAWANESQTAWDSRSGQNHVYSFSMLLRGWNNYLQVGKVKIHMAVLVTSNSGT